MCIDAYEEVITPSSMRTTTLKIVKYTDRQGTPSLKLFCPNCKKEMNYITNRKRTGICIDCALEMQLGLKYITVYSYNENGEVKQLTKRKLTKGCALS